MDNLIKQHSIDKEGLKRGNYFQSLISAALEAGTVSPDMFHKLQAELMALLKKQVFRYTGGDSTSVRTETAKDLTNSIYYCIGAYLKTIPEADEQINELKQKNMEDLLWKGIEVIKSCVGESKKLLEHLQRSALKINNLAYNDTIFKGIPPFFLYYDADFAAYDCPGSIDYPLSDDAMDLTGAEYLYEYLSHLIMENDFCRKFPDDTITKLLRGCSSTYVKDLINIYEAVLCNVLGQSMLGKSEYDLNITGDDRQKLFQILKSLPEDHLQEFLENEFRKVCSGLEIKDPDTVQYLKRCIGPVSSRIKHNLELGTLGYIFVTLKEPEEKRGKAYYDGLRMTDAKLRSVIDEMKECRYTSDKIAMVKENIKSLADLSEVMKECFFGDEVKEVYKLLNKEEYEELKKLYFQ